MLLVVVVNVVVNGCGSVGSVVVGGGSVGFVVVVVSDGVVSVILVVVEAFRVSYFGLGLECKCLAPLNMRKPVTSELPSQYQGRLKPKGKEKMLTSVQPTRDDLLNPLALLRCGTVGTEKPLCLGADCLLSGNYLPR